MFASQTRRANQLTFALLCGFTVLGLLVARTQVEAVYNAIIYYLLLMAALLLALQVSFFRTLHPTAALTNREASFGWYYGWGIGMVGLGAVAAMLLAWFYLAQVDEAYWGRQLLWEASELRRQGVSESMIPLVLQNLRDEQSGYIEIQLIAFASGLTAVVGSLAPSAWFYLTGAGAKRDANLSH